MSIASVADPFVLIAGGDAKGATFEGLAAALDGRQCTAILLGQDADAIAAALASTCPVSRVAGMAEAVALAGEKVQPGGTVLLAPACSSLDMFENFAVRGEAFAAAVRELEA
jgi:UDP-N-acetylmuramoylalanine--D-glutamate ligase